jgi:hypothetical protein
MKGILAHVDWISKNVILTPGSILLFCFDERSMPGKISAVKCLDENNYYEITTTFIDGSYFEDVEAKDFTINEASKILAYGKVLEFLR